MFIKDIVDAIKDIEDFVGNMDYEEFLKDKKHIYFGIDYEISGVL